MTHVRSAAAGGGVVVYRRLFVVVSRLRHHIIFIVFADLYICGAASLLIVAYSYPLTRSTQQVVCLYLCIYAPFDYTPPIRYDDASHETGVVTMRLSYHHHETAGFRELGRRL